MRAQPRSRKPTFRVQKKEVTDVEKWRIKSLTRRELGEKIVRDEKIARLREKRAAFQKLEENRPLKYQREWSTAEMREWQRRRGLRSNTEIAFLEQADRQPSYSLRARPTGESLHRQAVEATKELMEIQHGILKKQWTFTKNERLAAWLKRWKPLIERGGKKLIISYLQSKGAHEKKLLSRFARQFLYDPRSTYDLAQKIPEK